MLKLNTVRMIHRMKPGVRYYAFELGKTDKQLKKLVAHGLLEKTVGTSTKMNLYEKQLENINPVGENQKECSSIGNLTFYFPNNY